MNAHLIGYKRSVILVLFIAIGSTGLGRILLIDNRYGLRPNSFLPIKRKAQLHGSFCFNKKEKQKISTSSSITKLTIISKIWTAADRKEDLLVTSSEDDSIRMYNITSAT
jgi:hypothetical protein